MQELIKEILAANGEYGAMGALAAAIFAFVRILRLPVVQSVLGMVSSGLQWESWSKGLRMSVVFGTALIGSGLLSYLGGVGVLPAIVAGLTAAVAAIGAHQTTKEIGRMVDAKKLPMNGAEPTFSRRLASIVVPMDPNKFPRPPYGK